MFGFLNELIGLWDVPDSHKPAIGRILFGLVGAAMGAKFAAYLNTDHWFDYAVMTVAAIGCFVFFAKFWRKVFEDTGNS